MGSSTILTDAAGKPYQFFANLPFGETMAEQLPTSYYATPYKFNGKELDESTGLYYYGARYYDPVVSGWLSVDPMMEHAPDKTPYHYCSNNPINRTDPTGMCDDPNCSHGGMRKAWDSVGRFFGAWGYSNRSSVESVGPVEEIRAQQISEYQDFLRHEGTVQEWRNLGVWDDNAEYDNWAHAVGSQLGLVAPTARFGGLFKIFSKSDDVAKTGGRAFFSGAGTEARAIEQGYQTLGQTRAGRNLQNLIDSKNIPWSQAEPMWQRLSATWAKGIPNGSSVPVFLNNPRAGAVWFQTELPILQSKGVNLIYK